MTTRRDGQADIEQARDELAQWLPPALRGLAYLAYNYRWAWLPDGAALFREIEPGIWRQSGCNARHVIEIAPPQLLERRAEDRNYVARVQAAAKLLEADLAAPPIPGIPAEHPVAYVCSEFAVHCSLPLYGGGLGVLAGDLLKTASDLRLPMVGVGLLYREGYFGQRLDPSGWQHEFWVPTPFDFLPAVRVTRASGDSLTVEMTLRSRRVQIGVWRINVGRVPLFLLDTDRLDNHPIDRWITNRLYVGDRQTRLAQYAVLGIGGMRALAEMGIEPSLVHLNEGHGALSSFERLGRCMRAGRTFADALEEVRSRTVFTTHTPVAAGNEAYWEGEVEPLLGGFADDLGMPRSAFYDLGRVTPGAAEPANITVLALRTSTAANGVSRRHGEISRAMWHALWPQRSVEEVPIGHVTNGVHAATWMSNAMQALLDRHLGTEWRGRLCDAEAWSEILRIPDADLWRTRCELRRRLVEYVREKSIRDRLGRGEAPDYVEQAARAFDPGVLTVGFARRVATYKRLYLLTRFADRGLRLLADAARPMQMLVAGKAHPQDQEAKESLRRLFQIKQAPGVGGKVAFLESYDLHMAPRLVAGVDVWINVPRPPMEASGTSGMKIALNGGLNVSVLDGWWSEGYEGENGWAIASVDGDPNAQDDHDARALLDLLEGQVLPLFYDRDADGVPRGWVHRIKTSMRTIVPRFNTERMLREYADRMYAGAARE